jgi:hypothetical protein
MAERFLAVWWNKTIPYEAGTLPLSALLGARFFDSYENAKRFLTLVEMGGTAVAGLLPESAARRYTEIRTDAPLSSPERWKYILAVADREVAYGHSDEQAGAHRAVADL